MIFLVTGHPITITKSRDESILQKTFQENEDQISADTYAFNKWSCGLVAVLFLFACAPTTSNRGEQYGEQQGYRTRTNV